MPRNRGHTAERHLKSIARTRLTQAVYTLLRDRMASHAYAPGERLKLDVLADQLGVSRTPVREALNQLAAEGLIEIRPRRGTFVAQVDRAAVAELYQLRLMIDTFVGRLLARRITPQQVRALGKLVDGLAEQVDGDTYRDYGAYLERDREYHSAIVRLVRNKRLSSLYDEINLPLWLVRAQREAGPPRDARISLSEHRAILNALAAGDPRRAAMAMGAHIASLLDRLGAPLTPADHANFVLGLEDDHALSADDLVLGT